MSGLIWRLRLGAELEPGVVSETEVVRIEREDFVVSEILGLTLDESKALRAAIQAEVVSAQVAVMGQRFRWCRQCGAKLLSKGYYPTTFRSLFGDVPLRVRQLSACSCRAEMLGAKSFTAWAPMGGIAPELGYITAKYAALAPFARVADLLSELLPTGGTANAGTVRNRTSRVGSTVAQPTPVSAEMLEPDAFTAEVIVWLDGGYVRSHHPRPERNFEVVAGKVIGSDGIQHRFAFARNGASAKQFAHALVRAGVRGGTPSTVLSDGDTGLRNLQRRVLPKAAVVLDCWSGRALLPASWCRNVAVGRHHTEGSHRWQRSRRLASIWPRTCSRSTSLMRRARYWCVANYSRAEVLEFFAKVEPCLVGIEACATAH